MELISQGAEAKVYKVDFLGRPAVLKERLKKAYRHPTLDDELTKRRLKDEARCLAKCVKLGMNVPAVLNVDLPSNSLILEYIDGQPVKHFIKANDAAESKDQLLALARGIGAAMARIHEANVVHGDLTTSNLMMDARHTVFIIDFGLAYVSTGVEDKAVDLYVLERCFCSSHPDHDFMVDELLQEYVRASARQSAAAVMKRLEQVRLRGRKRDMSG